MSDARLVRWSALGGVVLLAACTDQPPLFIQLPDLPPTIGFLLTFGELDGPPSSVSEAFDLQLGSDTPANVTAREGDTLVLVSLDDEPLGSTSARRRSAPANQHVLELNTETCPHGRLSQPLGDSRLRVSLPKAAVTYAATFDRPRFEPISIDSLPALVNASVSLPVQAGGCDVVADDAVRSFQPDRERLFDVGAMVGGRPAQPEGRLREGLALFDLTALDDTRLGGVTSQELLLFERGRNFVDASTHHLSPSEVTGLPVAGPGEIDVWSWNQVAAIPAVGGEPAALLAGIYSETMVEGERVGIRSALVRVELDGAGFGPARTATAWSGELVRFTVETDGRVYAIFNESKASRGSDRDAIVLRGESPAGPWSIERLTSKIAARSLVRTEDPQNPHLLGFSIGRVMFGDLAVSPVQLRVLASELTGDADALTSFPSEDGLLVWVGTDRGLISRLSASSPVVTPLIFRLPMDAARCGASIDECGWPVGTDRTLSLEYAREAGVLIATFQACEAAIVLRELDLCPSAVRFPGDTEIGDERGVRRLSRASDQLLMYEISTRTAEISVQ